MNDLETIRSALSPDAPAQDAVDRSRHRLQNHIRGGVPLVHKRTGWLIAGVGVTVTAAAAAATIIALPPDAPARPSADEQSAARPARTVTGQEILLAAATAAAQTPDGDGTYWYTKFDTPDDQPWENWVKADDGDTWFRGQKTENEVRHWGPLDGLPDPTPFRLFGVDVSKEQLRAMPTDPDALKAWIADALEHSDARSSKGAFTEEDRTMALFLSLISLVSTVPAPAAVRAAAFRAIAAYPDVRSLGDVPGGQGLQMPWGARLVVDPATGRVNGTSVFILDGAVYTVSDPRGARITAEWTNTLPS